MVQARLALQVWRSDSPNMHRRWNHDPSSPFGPNMACGSWARNETLKLALHSTAWIPATGQHLTRIAEASQADVDAAVAAARSAYENVWRDMAPANRARYLFRIARLIQERALSLQCLSPLMGQLTPRVSRRRRSTRSGASSTTWAGPTSSRGPSQAESSHDRSGWRHRSFLGTSH